MTEEYTIEKGIPFPCAGYKNKAFTVLDDMEVGDSILFPLEEWRRARNQAYIRKPKQFTFRKASNGYRCWRVR
jgi:hypothetical protein